VQSGLLVLAESGEQLVLDHVACAAELIG